MDITIIIIIVLVLTMPLYYLLFRYDKYKKEKETNKLIQEVSNIISKEKRRLNSEINKEIEELKEEIKEIVHKEL